MPSLAFIHGRLTVRTDSLLLFSKTVLPNLLTAWSNSFVCISLILPNLLAGSLLTFNLSQNIDVADEEDIATADDESLEEDLDFEGFME